MDITTHALHEKVVVMSDMSTHSVLVALTAIGIDEAEHDTLASRFERMRTRRRMYRRMDRLTPASIA